ncbi:hypothetical protein GQ457_14G012840 [Hibiscus cannabinus]
MELQHFSHQHPLVLVESDKPYCSGCGELISGPSFGCADCGFWLDKVCAEAPVKIYHPFHGKDMIELVVSPRSGIFAVKNVAILQSMKVAFHCHPSLGFHDIAIGRHEIKTRKCEACPEEVNAEHGVYCCFDCNYIVHAKCAQQYGWFKFDDLNDKDEQLQEKSAFVVIKETQHGEDTEIKHIKHQHNLVLSNDSDSEADFECLRLPNKILHRCDEHPLMLAYPEDNLYSEYNYCDICEQTRDPTKWFYHCATCNTSTHRKCAVKRSVSGRVRFRSGPFQVGFISGRVHFRSGSFQVGLFQVGSEADNWQVNSSSGRLQVNSNRLNSGSGLIRFRVNISRLQIGFGSLQPQVKPGSDSIGFQSGFQVGSAFYIPM